MDFAGIVERRTRTRIVFYTGTAGQTIHPQISKNGAAFQVATDDPAHEISGGFYYFDLMATELDSLGPVAVLAGTQQLVVEVRDLVSELATRIASRMATKDDLVTANDSTEQAIRKLINNGVRAQLIKRLS